MKFHLSAVLLACSATALQAGAAINFHEETLRYNINWPTGLSLGEATTKAVKLKSGGPEGDRWKLDFELDAAIPAFQVTDRISSLSNEAFCSVAYQKDSTHGKKVVKEKTAVDPANGVAERTTENGGKSSIPVAACVHDGLGFLFFLRNELAQGRIPPPQTILFGSAYQLRLEYGGAKSVPIGGVATPADRMLATVKGPASETAFEIFFGRDAKRTPLLVRVPLVMGSFSMELVQ